MAFQKTPTAEPQGHTPTLAACFLHFDVSFMLWVLLGALGVYIAEGLKLGPAEKAMVVAVPILSGSLLRVPLGLLSDRFGGKRSARSCCSPLRAAYAGLPVRQPSAAT